MQPGASAPSFKKWGHGHMTSQAVVCAGRGGEPCAAQLSGPGVSAQPGEEVCGEKALCPQAGFFPPRSVSASVGQRRGKQVAVAQC